MTAPLKIPVQVVRFGPPADRHGEIFAPGSIRAAAAVPVTRAFDSSDVIGTAAIDEHGAAVLELTPAAVDVTKIRHVGIGFRVLDSEFVDGIRTIKDLELLTVGVEFARPLPVVGGVGEQWAEYLVACELTAAPPRQLEELRLAFYAGAQGMYYAVLGAAANDDDAASDAKLEAIARELGDYIRLFKSREGIKP